MNIITKIIDSLPFKIFTVLVGLVSVFSPDPNIRFIFKLILGPLLLLILIVRISDYIKNKN
jgi:hypothetical protein